MRTVERLIATSLVELRQVDPESPDAQRCLRAYVAELNRRAPDAGSIRAKGATAEPHEVRPPHGAFVVAYLRGEADRLRRGQAPPRRVTDVKRMWLAESARGLGLGRRLLGHLEGLARDHGSARPTSRPATSWPRRSSSTAPPATSRSSPSTTSPSPTAGSRSRCATRATRSSRRLACCCRDRRHWLAGRSYARSSAAGWVGGGGCASLPWPGRWSAGMPHSPRMSRAACGRPRRAPLRRDHRAGRRRGHPVGRRRSASRPRGLWTAASFGEPLPERVTRAIVVARLADLVEGHSGARPKLAAAVARMVDGALPAVPARGNGGSGEVLALGHLFGELADRIELEPQEKMALINGSPCAAALVADAALAGRGRLELTERTFALSVEAIRAPLEAFAPELGELWRDDHEAEALRSLTALLGGGAPERQEHQAPVSYRVLPRVLGRLREAQNHAERTATASLGSVTVNPVFLWSGDGHGLGRLISNGGYHNDRAHPALDALGHAWADVAQLVQRHVDKLFQHPVSAPLVGDEWLVKPLHMVAAGYAEEARTLAQTTVIGLGGFGQNDLPSPAFLAWSKATAAGACLDRALAVLAAVPRKRSTPPHRRRRPRWRRSWRRCVPRSADRGAPSLGPDAERLAAAFSAPRSAAGLTGFGRVPHRPHSSGERRRPGRDQDQVKQRGEQPGRRVR